MDIKPCGTVPSRRPSKDYFTGQVLQDPLIEAEAPARLRAVVVHFDPGARTAWHTHPLGQTLYILSGSGLAQTWDGPVRQIKAGDVVWFSPGEKHWHGAGPDTAMTHIAMHEALDGTTAEWLEKVSDEQYAGR